MIIVLLIILWTISSIIWFICNLGNKNKPGHWYDWFIGFPALVVAYIVVTVISLFTKKF